MFVAIVTGSSSGIGQAITEKLLEMNYKVYGIARRKQESSENFFPVECDITHTVTLEKSIQDILKTDEISLLINSAGIGKFEPHEELSQRTIIDMTFLNLTTPMLLTNTLLRSLKKSDGYVININSIEALRASKFAGVYSATKAGLKAFGDALFEETRKSALSVTNINPDMTQSSFYDELRFDVSDKEDEKLFASDIADAIKHILSMRKGAVVSEYTIRSLKFGISKKKN